MDVSGLFFSEYKDEYKESFYLINSQWISEMFFMEEVDKKVLSEPKKNIIDQGGYIWFAVLPNVGAVGACAVKRFGAQGFELTKMGVIDKYRGCKIGEKLLHHVLEKCQELPIKKLFLISNKNCQSAIHLYEKNGFVHDANLLKKVQQTYDRADVAMRYLHI